jgi:hypothetical protein
VLEYEKHSNRRDINFDCGDLWTALGRDSKESEQAWPATVAVIAALYTAVTNDHDYETLLIFAASTLCLQRIDSFLGLGHSDVKHNKVTRKTKATFRNLKGENVNKTHTVEFE